MPDLLCNKAEAGFAVPGVLLYEANLGACSINEHRWDILSAGTCNARRVPFSAQVPFAELAQHDTTVISWSQDDDTPFPANHSSSQEEGHTTCMGRCFQWEEGTL